jgi:predicted DNA-binding protein YlxM (UPF0122 family)
MENNAFLEALKALVQNEDVLAVSREVSELKIRFEDFILEEERKDQIASLDAADKGEEYESKDYKPLKNAFYEVYNEYRERRKVLVDEKNAAETSNLKQKLSLLSRLKDIIENEENIGAAYGAYKEIHEAWKTIGDIARDKRDEIQKEYSRLLEHFFYTMNIYRQIKEHDLKRNLQLKKEVINLLGELKNNESIKEIEGALKIIQNEWEEIGPVPNEEWEQLKTAYWDSVRACYERINSFYEERKQLFIDNLNSKKALVQETADLIAKNASHETIKMWEEATNQLLTLQEKWKTIGFGPRKENEEVWQEFRSLCNQFFADKKSFFSTIQEKFNKIADAKKAIIEQAKTLKDSTEWKNTADKLIQLQKEWKNAGHAGQKIEQKLWQEFRGACDSFFNARKRHFEEQDKAFETNLIAKQAVVQSVQSYQMPEDSKQALADLREFNSMFNAAGKVPMKEREDIYNAFKEAMNQHYSKLKLESAEKEKLMIQTRIEKLASSPDPEKAFSKEKAAIRQQIDTLKSDIIKYENNLGFFAKSKGADELKKEVERKINASKSKIDALIRQLKMIPNE